MGKWKETCSDHRSWTSCKTEDWVNEFIPTVDSNVHVQYATYFKTDYSFPLYIFVILVKQWMV